MICFKCDVLKELKNKGYNTNVLRHDKLLNESTIQSLRVGKDGSAIGLSLRTIDKICKLIGCDICDLLYYDNDVFYMDSKK